MSEDGLTELSRAIECLLFASPDTLSTDRLAEILEANPAEVEQAVGLLRETLDDHGLQLVELAGGYQLATRPEHASLVHRMLQPAPARLSTQGLEVLAIIAYQQPITRPEIDAIRGVNSQHSVATLAEKGLVTTVGRKDAPGRPVLYATTPHFLGAFGLRDLGSLPNLEELRQAIAQQEPQLLLGVSQTGDDAVPGEPGADSPSEGDAEAEVVEALPPTDAPEHSAAPPETEAPDSPDE